MTTPWNETELASYDCETTGLDVDSDRIVTAALIDPNSVNVRWLANPGVDIPTAASDVHGITTAHARKHGQRPSLVVDEIAGALADVLEEGKALVVMNAPYDLTLLDRECARHGVTTVAERLGRPVGPVIDPLVLDRAADKYRKGPRKLEALAAHYEVDLTNAHTAEADAEAALGVAVRIAERFPELQVSAEVLHRWQVTWYARWADGYEAYRRKTDADYSLSRAWPLLAAEAVNV